MGLTLFLVSLYCSVAFSLKEYNREFWEENEITSFHDNGVTGENEKICIMDSGINSQFSKTLKKKVKAFDFTSDHSTEDYLNHGTSSFSILGSRDSFCPGIVPDAQLVSFKIVDKNERILTSSVLKALSQSIIEQCTIVVMSFGGRDLDEPIIQTQLNKVLEHGIMVIASAGNEGPSYGSVLSPADYPGVISVGALRDSQTPLVSSSRGYRSHSIQRKLPEFLVHGYHIPCVTNQLQCKGVSGTSIAAPLFAGIVSLKRQAAHQSGASPGATRCFLHGRLAPFCCVPASLSLPSSDYPHITHPLAFQEQPREIRISLFSAESVSEYRVHSNCLWIEILSVHHIAPFVSELVLSIHPLRTAGNFSCEVHVNNTLLPITVTMSGRSSLREVVWIEGTSGNTRLSNGDSAYTNYFTLYHALRDEFIVQVIQKGIDQSSMNICVCLVVCRRECRYPVYIMGIDKTRSVLLQQEMRERYNVISVRHGRECTTAIQGREFRHIVDYVEVVKFTDTFTIHHPLRNNLNQLVGFVGNSDSECFGFIGVGSVINDMQTLSELPGKQIVTMIKTMYSILSSFDRSDEL